MLSLIDVQCPHCGARGQIMVPPLGAIIIGPCPQCKELVVVFCGHVLALEKQLMIDGSTSERRDHLLEVLTEFLRERLSKLLNEDTPWEEGISAMEEDDQENELVKPASAEGSAPNRPITQGELERFTKVDLKLLDNTSYFRSVFESD